jgi:hypothetical protein
MDLEQQSKPNTMRKATFMRASDVNGLTFKVMKKAGRILKKTKRLHV